MPNFLDEYLVRLGTSVPPRLSEFAILCTARFWQAQYEWTAHAAIAAKQGVKPATIRDLQAGRAPNSAPPKPRFRSPEIVTAGGLRRADAKLFLSLPNL